MAARFLLRLFFAVMLLAGILAAGRRPVYAATCTSTGSGAWGGTETIWDCGVPASTDDVVIANGRTVTLDGDAAVHSLTIQSGGTLQGDNRTHTLSVGGDWNNAGTFTHNSTNVTLDGVSGSTQILSGTTIFNKLTLNASRATIDFGSSSVTIQSSLQHKFGSMLAGTSTFTFRDNTTIGGSGLKRFHNLVIDGVDVTHSSGDMRISGDLTVNDGKSFTFSGVATKKVRFDGTSTQTVTLNSTGIITFASMIVESGAVVVLPAAADTRLTAESVTNNGVLRQSRTSVSGATSFLRIQDQSGVAQYQGLDLTPGSGSPDITVAVAGNTSVCTNPNGGNYRDRCFRVTSSAAATGTAVTLYTTTAEDDIANDAFYQYVGGGTWANRADCAGAVGASCSAPVDLTVGDNYFLIGDANSAPTPVTLASFTAAWATDGVLVAWRTATELNFAGFYVVRSQQEAGPYTRVSPFIPARGSGITGADYSFLDRDAGPEEVHFYELEAVDFDGSTEFHGPVSTGGQANVTGHDGSLIYLPLTMR